MRKYFGGLFLVLAIAMLVPGTALASHTNGEAPDKDFQSAAHRASCPTPFGTFRCHVEINADGFSSTGSGIPARGHWFIDIVTNGFMNLPDPVRLHGEVVCHTAVLHNAWSRLKVEMSNTPLVPKDFTFLDRSIDNGEGNKDPEDESTRFLTPPGATTCPTIPIATTPIESGNIVVHDGI